MGLVKFYDLAEKTSNVHFGMIDTENNITCFCCGGIIPPGEYKIIRFYPLSDLKYLEEYLQKDFSE